ncbi:MULTISPECIES: 3-keto-5-aminohexanoate cleavage protein [Vibrio]|uniref:3-keto-5-aminohexanoate cleavage protein n=1 Tax=Vibrio TaxID=662 RepID=UPI002075EC9E|nr:MULTISPECIES: 3-keto-5-aminohexanoate cleavage protein [Vibrio]USD34862.1 3-keto-5-aminohexanoate cleavage protein [Vibrio sp. SCSIO 43186]USD47927.1 3-keto-5-aminohexanoate cleavage protein [Vibrio sp. SCSIO 43145]USD71986.1 3-keto-5-aminohexanoate cleavage protein [Vibrio sp. SCSIO 43139]USD97654.1 3-keto-5-aminohexanoate cleavage protein [Vibrio coralliilyticus]
MDKLIITAAVNGGITPRSKQPAIPHTPKEIADAVIQCSQAGASVAHIHARDDAGRPSYDQAVWREIIERIRERSDILLNLSTSGLNLPKNSPEEEAWNHLEYRPEIASFNCGSVNHGDKPFINSPALAKKLAQALKANQVMPEIEIYHSGVIHEAVTLQQQGYLGERLVFAFAMGIHGGVRPTCKDLLHLVDSLPANSLWSAIGIGQAQLPLNTYSILLGGHVRTGLEDNIYYRKGELATSNAQLVDRVVRLSHELGRDVATVNEARALLGLSRPPPQANPIAAATI